MIRIYTIIEGVMRMPIAERGAALKVHIAAEKPHSIRRKELERLHVEVVRRQLKHETPRKRRRK